MPVALPTGGATAFLKSGKEQSKNITRLLC
jgi:hypothetical protein